MKPGELFGKPVVQKRGKHYIQPKGYAFPPGTGPRGETCQTCQHRYSRRTDILVRSPACQYWKPR